METRVEFILRAQTTGEIIYVDAVYPSKDYYSTFRVFRGTPGEMIEYGPVGRVTRYKDGGTTEIPIGPTLLFIPYNSSFVLATGKNYKESKWGDEVLEKILDLKNFDIKGLGIPKRIYLE